MFEHINMLMPVQFWAVHGISTSRKISEGIWLYMILKHLDTDALCPTVAHDETPWAEALAV
jgi:hypothetical protein